MKVLRIFNKFMKFKFKTFTEDDYVNCTKNNMDVENYECYDKLINYYYNNCSKFDISNDDLNY